MQIFISMDDFWPRSFCENMQSLAWSDLPTGVSEFFRIRALALGFLIHPRTFFKDCRCPHREYLYGSNDHCHTLYLWQELIEIWCRGLHHVYLGRLSIRNGGARANFLSFCLWPPSSWPRITSRNLHEEVPNSQTPTPCR